MGELSDETRRSDRKDGTHAEPTSIPSLILPLQEFLRELAKFPATASGGRRVVSASSRIAFLPRLFKFYVQLRCALNVLRQPRLAADIVGKSERDRQEVLGAIEQAIQAVDTLTARPPEVQRVLDACAGKDADVTERDVEVLRNHIILDTIEFESIELLSSAHRILVGIDSRLRDSTPSAPVPESRSKGQRPALSELESDIWELLGQVEHGEHRRMTSPAIAEVLTKRGRTRDENVVRHAIHNMRKKGYKIESGPNGYRASPDAHG